MMATQHARPLEIDPDMEADERRILPRRAILIRADVQIPGKPLMKTHAVDLSRGGLGLQSPVAAEIDQEIVVNLPLNVCGEQRIVVLTGRVRYCTKQSEQHFRIGLQFVHLDAATAAFVTAVCD
jgi:c-di-GMP-binding flagellar brake protein YcgR